MVVIDCWKYGGPALCAKMASHLDAPAILVMYQWTTSMWDQVVRPQVQVATWLRSLLLRGRYLRARENSGRTRVLCWCMCEAVIVFQPMYGGVHPEVYLFLFCRIISFGTRYPKELLFYFESKITGVKCSTWWGGSAASVTKKI